MKRNDYMFEWGVLRHMDAAYNLARWMVRNEQDAEDVVQDAAIRAYKSFESFRGPGDAKSWFLAIVRNASLNKLRQRNSDRDFEPLMQESIADTQTPNPEDLLIRAYEADILQACIEKLPIAYREVVVLREIEEMSYREIATVVGVPIGTVMSRLARARGQLQASLMESEAQGAL